MFKTAPHSFIWHLHFYMYSSSCGRKSYRKINLLVICRMTSIMKYLEHPDSNFVYKLLSKFKKLVKILVMMNTLTKWLLSAIPVCTKPNKLSLLPCIPFERFYLIRLYSKKKVAHSTRSNNVTRCLMIVRKCKKICHFNNKSSTSIGLH